MWVFLGFGPSTEVIHLHVHLEELGDILRFPSMQANVDHAHFLHEICGQQKQPVIYPVVAYLLHLVIDVPLAIQSGPSSMIR